MEPSSAVAGVPVAAVIRGTSFNLVISTSVDNSSIGVRDTFRVWLGESELTEVTWVDTATLRATVPALAPGTYDLVVEDPAGQSGTLPNALTVWPVTPEPTELVLATAPQTVLAGECSDVVNVEVRRVGDGPVAVTTDATVALSASPTGVAVTFFLDPSCSTPVDAVVIPTGATGVGFCFSGAEPGSVTVTATIAGLAPATQDETITACALENCLDGCCDGSSCTHGNEWPTCGAAGAACVACDPATTNLCDGAGNCTCGATGGACAPGELCVGSDAAGMCVSAICDATSCPNGCCDGSTCSAPTGATCGSGGGPCASCDSTLADRCTAVGTCGCGTGAACVPGQRCVADACVCDATSCPNGCCAGTDCVDGLSNDACGTGGAACQSCVPDTCAGGACSSCNATTCAAGCCSGSTCAAPSLATCGAGGQPCTVCDPTLGDGCSASGTCQCGTGTTCTTGTECIGGTCRPACPADMVRVGQTDVCIDRYEASASGGIAQSVAGVAPSVSLHQKQAGTRCNKAGKRLCTAAEWQAACAGPGGQEYAYGATFVAGQCSDTNGGQCLGDGSGVLPTGSKADCVGSLTGHSDMSGNVWEWVSDTQSGSCLAAGGSVDACGDAAVLACTSLASFGCNTKWAALGFRCCLTQAW
jgi:hypothetical protein